MKRRAKGKASRCCQVWGCWLPAGQVYSPRRPLRVGRATPGRRNQKGAGRKQEGPPAPLFPRQSLTSRALLGGALQLTSVEATLLGLCSTPNASPRLSSGHLRDGEGGSGGAGWRWGRGTALPELRAVPQLLMPLHLKAPERPPPLPSQRRFPRRACPEKGGAQPDRATAGEELAEGPPPGSARGSTAPEASLQGPGCNFSSVAPICARAHARSHSGPRAHGAQLPRAPSVYFFLLLSFSHSKIGHGVEVTPGTASASDAKAAFPPRLRESIATIRFGGASRPHSVQEARRPRL